MFKSGKTGFLMYSTGLRKPNIELRELARRARSSMLSRGLKFDFFSAKDRGHRDRARTSAIERERARTSAGSAIRDPRLSAMYSFVAHSFRNLVNLVVNVD